MIHHWLKMRKQKIMKTRFGYFQDNSGTAREIDWVFVLVIHYDFSSREGFELKKRIGDAEDVERLRSTFKEKRNCSFHEILSPTKDELFELISNEEKLLQLFRGSSLNCVPEIFILFILSHGGTDGIIYTDHFQPESKEMVYFYRHDVFQKLASLKKFKTCLKFINFGPCRGLEYDPILSPSENKLKTNSKVSKLYFVPNIYENLVVAYSTLETKIAKREDAANSVTKMGTYYVQSFCDVLDELQHDTNFADVLTMVQHEVHRTTTTNPFNKSGQTPEFTLFPHKKIIIRCVEKAISQPGMSCGHDGKADTSRLKNTPIQRDAREHFFKWQSDTGETLRSRRAAIFRDPEVSKYQAMKMDKALTRNLLFETSLHNITTRELNNYFTNSKLLDYENVGCCLAAFFTKTQVDEKSGEISITTTDDVTVPAGDIISTCVGPENKNMTGKPYLFFFINQVSPAADNMMPHEPQLPNLNYAIRATQYSGYLAFFALSEDIFERLLEILDGKLVKNGKSIQELLSELLHLNPEDVSNFSASNNRLMLIASTLQYSLDFPDLPSRFVQPTLKISNQNYKFETFLRLVESLENMMLVVSSDAGMGKTTMVLELSNILRKKMKRKIVLLQLVRFYEFFPNGDDECDCTLYSLLAKALSVTEERIIDLNNSEGFFVFLDGFDEIATHFKGLTSNILRELVKRKIPFLITTRPEEENALKSILKEAKIIGLENFDRNQQLELMKIVTQEREEECENKLKSFRATAMGDVLGNPLHLTIVSQGKNAKNMWEVYDEFLHTKVAHGLEFKDNIRIDNAKGQMQIKDRIKFLQKVTYDQVKNDLKTKEFSEDECCKINNTGVAWISGSQIIYTHKTVSDFLVCRKFVFEVQNKKAEKDATIMSHDRLSGSRSFLDLYLSQDEKNFRLTLMEIVKQHVPPRSVLFILSEGHKNMFNAFQGLIREAVNSQISDIDLLNKTLNATISNNIQNAEFAKFLLDFEFPIKDEVQKHEQTAMDLVMTRFKNGEDALFLAQKLYDKNQSLVKTEPNDETTFQQAAEKKDSKMCGWLLEIKNDEVDFIKMGKHPFDYVAQNAQFGLEVGKYLISIGVKPEVQSLKKAVRLNNFKLAELLFFNLADENKRLGGNNILHFAIRIDSIEFVIHVSQKYGKELVSQLTDHGVTALQLAASYSGLSMCKLIEKFDIEFHASEDNGHVFCHDRCLPGLIRNQAFLAGAPSQISNGIAYFLSNFKKIPGTLCPSMFSVLSPSGENAFHAAARNENRIDELVALAQHFKTNKVAIDLKNKMGNTPFQIAILNQRTDLALYLMKNGADVKNSCGKFNAFQFFIINDNLDGAKEVYKRHSELLGQLTDKGESCLHLAVMHSSIKMFNWLLQIGANLHAVTKNGDNVLHLVHHQVHEVYVSLSKDGKNFEMFNKIKSWVKFLVSKGADISLKNNQGKIPLQIALEDKSTLSLAKELMEYSAPPEMKLDGHNLLHIFIKYENLDDIKYIHHLHRELIKERSDKGDYALHLAARCCKDRETFEWLVENGADVHALNWNGDNVLHVLASKYELNFEIVQYFFDLGVNINSKNIHMLTPLQVAAEHLSFGSIRGFVELGAELFRNGAKYNVLHVLIKNFKLDLAEFIHSKDNKVVTELTGDGYTALHLAVQFSKLEMCKWLIEINGVDVHAVTEQGDNILHIAARRHDNEGKQILEYILATFEVNINQKNKSDETPLFIALVPADNIYAAKKLIESGADCRVKCGGVSLLHASLENNGEYALDAIELLKDKGVLEELTEEGENILHLSARYANISTCIYVQNFVADLHATTNDGSTVLHMAALNKVYGRDIIEHFMSLGLDLDLEKVSNDGKLALDVANSIQNYNASSILLKYYNMLFQREDAY
ncbi:uncharacterized protein LOC135948392 [Cloeon dipterum]|uniref:uncharacterized protein LOC135948392 n=1 Tax=Cloeon dipterum TaxID=197152 RepID=UPI00322014C4